MRNTLRFCVLCEWCAVFFAAEGISMPKSLISCATLPRTAITSGTKWPFLHPKMKNYNYTCVDDLISVVCCFVVPACLLCTREDKQPTCILGCGATIGNMDVQKP